MAVSSIRLSQGRRPFTAGGKLSKAAARGVANKVEVTIRAKRLPEVMRPLYEELAKEHRRRIAAIARGVYSGAVQQTIAAAMHSGVPVDVPAQPERGERAAYRVGSRSSRRYRRYDERNMVPVNIVRRFQPFEKRLPPALDESRGSDNRVREIVDRSKMNLSDLRNLRISAKLDTSWRALRVDYARRAPRSEVFFKKTHEAEPALLSLLSVTRRKLGAASSYQKGRSISYRFSSGREKPHLKATFVISYPEMPGRWDFLRQAFLTNYPINLRVSGKLRGANRAIGAEYLRPMMVPLMRQYGAKYRTLLGKLK